MHLLHRRHRTQYLTLPSSCPFQKTLQCLFLSDQWTKLVAISRFLGTEGMYAAMTLFLHILYKRHSLELWYTPGNLSQIRLFGILGTLAGIAAICSYFGIAVENHEDLPWRENLSTSHYIMGCWAFLTLKWAISLAGFAHHYRKSLLDEYHPLLA
ncbi:heme transporter HRG1-like isoform X3 [Oratosquilla oratoria]|uniref:heme transporter HRG1-like isoform X3 n=1 Tax=Oratosquilla oratoria TaxID=337810 RepID=UPI003F76CC07